MTEDIIEAIVAAICDEFPHRNRGIVRETLRILVSVAQSEQVLAIICDFDTVAHAISAKHDK